MRRARRLLGGTDDVGRSTPKEGNQVVPRRRRSRVADGRQHLSPVDEAGAGTHEHGVGGDRPDGHAGRDDVAVIERVAQLPGARQVVTARRHDNKIGPTLCQRSR